MRYVLAIWTGKLVAFASRLLGRGGGTSLPGLIALRLCHDVDARLARKLPRGCVLITGTNGKTTTAKMVATILRRAGWRLVRNVSGANLRRGVASTLIADATLFGRPRGEFGLFEADEAAVREIVGLLAPRAVVVTNFFRDQLDRYGELDTTARRMNEAFRSALGSDAVLVLNLDDPLVQGLAEGCAAQVLGYGIEAGVGTEPFPREHNRLSSGNGGKGAPSPFHTDDAQAADTKNCPRCGADYEYSVRRFAHLGDYRCPACGYARSRPEVAAVGIDLHGTDGMDITLDLRGHALDVSVQMPGLYNVYNATAAAALCTTLGIGQEVIAEGLSSFSAAFGRVERIGFQDGKTALLLLAKNPTGFNEVIRTVSAAGERRHTLLALNDNIADGRDVSWIWDVDFERLVGTPASVVASGIRAHDMALRLKYAGFDQDSIHIEPDTRRALQVALDRAAPGETVNALLTYTALLDLRGRLEREGLAPRFWEE